MYILIERTFALRRFVTIIKLREKEVMIVNKLDKYYAEEYSKIATVEKEVGIRIEEEYSAEQKQYIDALPELIQDILMAVEDNHPECECLLERVATKRSFLKSIFSSDSKDEIAVRYGWKIYSNIYLLTSGRIVYYGYQKRKGAIYSYDVQVDEIDKDVNLCKIDAALLYKSLFNLGLSFRGIQERY